MIVIKKRNLAFLLAIALVLGALAPAIGTAVYRSVNGEAVPISKEASEEYMLLKEKYGELASLEKYISDNYYLPVDSDLFEAGIYKGLFSSVGDPYTTYYTAEEYQKMNENTQGEFFGIGAYMGNDDDGELIIAKIIEGGAADGAGLLAGDILLTINGESYKGIALDDAVSHLRGPEGSKVTLKVKRGDEIFEKTLTRVNVITPSVASRVLDGNIGYIAIGNFSKHTAEDFKKELASMENQKVKGLVLDLRNNLGGLVEQGVAIADMLLDAGIVATTKYQNDDDDETMTTKDGKTELPYVVLINENTASTSEILAGAIRDNDGGKLIGMTTVGKGIIQRLERFKTGDGARITVAQYYTPSGEPVHEVGITPDYVVEIPEDAETDLQLEKALEVLTSGGTSVVATPGAIE